VLPAHAGMVPGCRNAACSLRSAPRARGDGPRKVLHRLTRNRCSPRTRGWSRLGRGLELVMNVLPAHAGMVPVRQNPDGIGVSAPRARGDGPLIKTIFFNFNPCSPRTRGWSRHLRAHLEDAQVLPAHAGMVPGLCRIRSASPRAPRARGDGPADVNAARNIRECSPRTRGWSRSRRCCDGWCTVLPAHAGMVPGPEDLRGNTAGAPRARGDGPLAGLLHQPFSPCSPRTRGWSRSRWSSRVPRSVLPAHAGMVPTALSTTALVSSAPRARGDGPRR